MEQIGIRLPQPHETSFDHATECAIRADETGIDTVWIGESWHQNSVPLLTHTLTTTDTIDVCAGVFNVYSRSPALIAMTAGYLAHLSDHRFRLGLGTSGPQVIEQFHGYPFDAPLTRTREYIEIINAYLSGDTVEYDEEYFSIDGFALDYAPDHPIPIYNAAMGENNLELTGRLADGWIPLFVPTTGLQQAIATLETSATDAGRSIDDITIAPWIPTCISDTDPDRAITHVRSLLAFYISAMGDFYANTVRQHGFSDTVTAVRRAWTDGGLSAARACISEEFLAAFAVCGTPNDARETLAEYRSRGADMPVAYIPAYWAEPALITETITHLA